MKNVRDAAVLAILIIGMKLLIRLLPPSKGFTSLFEGGVWMGIVVMGIGYLVVFGVIYLIFTIQRRKK